MARVGLSQTLGVALLFLVVVSAAPGRKLMQGLARSEGNGRTTAVMNQGTANIAASASGKPGQAANLAVPVKPVAAPKKTDKGTTAQGAPEASQAATAANIQRATSGVKPSPKPTPKASDVPNLISSAKRSDKTMQTGSETGFQNQVTAGIARAVAGAGSGRP